jgi:16S rRNA (cytosine1402-N4)-methyltransferase
MRLGSTARASASEVVNSYTEKELVRIFREYGEERFAGRIARSIVSARSTNPIMTADGLAALISRAVPAKYAHERIHPATRVFQAIRIEVNRELEVLHKVLGQTIDLLLPGGRLCVISFHSLEDRIVKRFMRDNEPHCICPPKAPRCTCDRPGRLRAVHRKAIIADDQEVANNPRSRSAKLRVAERIADGLAV